MKFHVHPGGQENNHPSLSFLGVSCSAVKWGKASVEFEATFDEYLDKAFGSYLAFRLAKARVVTELSNCEVENGKTAHDHAIEDKTKIGVELKSTGTLSNTAASSARFGLNGGAGKTSEIGANAQNETKRSTASSNAAEKKESYSVNHIHISRSGGGKEFTFNFQALPGDYLKGTVEPRSWFQVELLQGSAEIAAKVVVAPDDILIEGKGGVWPKDMSPRKRRLLRALALSQLNFAPYLSKSVLTFLHERELKLDNATTEAPEPKRIEIED